MPLNLSPRDDPDPKGRASEKWDRFSEKEHAQSVIQPCKWGLGVEFPAALFHEAAK
ncbi:hypothetical protein SAMN05444158_4224 [Bradyrhizobium canariense]|uniref:Uncharacterized protein n=1 Tax=Bradyrhizobium canariense TaxID=255045 RepID=A0A1H1X9M0_9BRAD|nr:hypothetical protein SAMN05444158_4224 [Bradyrhizobium canariense]